MLKRGFVCAFVAAGVGASIASAGAAVGDPAAAPTSTAPTTVAAAPTSAAPTSVAPTVPLPEPNSAAADPVRNLVPAIVATPEILIERQARQETIATALTEGSTTVAVPTRPGTMCAVVPVTAPLMTEGRWERNGEPFATGELQRRDPPGYGDCISNDNGEELDDGVYQYVAEGPTGATSSAATLVVGVDAVDAWFRNNGTDPVCLVLLSPEPADFYAAYDATEPLAPGEAMRVELAAVRHDVRVFGCPPDEPRRTFRATPAPGTYTELFEVDAGPASTTGAATTVPGATDPAATTTTTTTP